MQHQTKLSWDQYKLYRAVLTESIATCDEIESIINPDVLTLEEKETKVVKPLLKIYEETGKLLKENNIIEEEKQQDLMWTDEQVKGMMNIFMKITHKFVGSDAHQISFDEVIEEVIREELPPIDVSFGASIAEKMGVLFGRMAP